MNQFQAPNETTVLIHCEHGSLKIECTCPALGRSEAGRVRLDMAHVTPPLERDDLFIAQANAFPRRHGRTPTADSVPLRRPCRRFEVQSAAALASTATGTVIAMRRELKLAMLGMIEGNGHPYSWSGIINGYDPDEMAKCPYAGIPIYMGKQPLESVRIPGARVTHIWCDDPADAPKVAAASLIENVVEIRKT
jgi:hypothetical protein